MEYFDQIASHYDQVRGEEIFNSLLKTVEYHHNGNNYWILDIGTGTGLFSVELAKRGFRGIGVDRNSQMLSQAISKGTNLNCCFEGVLGSAERLPFPSECFYIVISTNAIHHFDLIKHFKEISRILKLGGRYIIYTRLHDQNVRSIWGQYFPLFVDKEIRLYNIEDFMQMEKYFPEFKLESFEELKFEIPFSAERLIDEARQKKYSTFALYTEEEFQKAFKIFKANISKHKHKNLELETGQIIFRKIYKN